jgi:hypothetical protein
MSTSFQKNQNFPLKRLLIAPVDNYLLLKNQLSTVIDKFYTASCVVDKNTPQAVVLVDNL